MAEFDLGKLIDQALRSKEPDPHVIARRLVARIPAEHLKALVADLLAAKVREVIRLQRSTAVARPGASKWERHAPRLRYFVAGDWKMRDQLVAEDCDWLAEDHEARAAANAAVAAEFRELARRIRAAGVEHLGDLDETQDVAA